MKKSTNLTNKRFGRLVAIQPDIPQWREEKTWFCRCDCGTEKVIRQSDLIDKRQGTKSCGCLRRELALDGRKSLKHGLSHSPTYKAWASAKHRCSNPNDTSWPDYGGRGITMCDRWGNDFMSFLQDMGIKPNRFSLERIDNSKGYSPENCRWANAQEQANNTRQNRIVTVDGITGTVAKVCAQLGFNRHRFHDLMRSGPDRKGRSAQAAADWIRNAPTITIDGITGTVAKVCEQLRFTKKQTSHMYDLLRPDRGLLRTPQEAANWIRAGGKKPMIAVIDGISGPLFKVCRKLRLDPDRMYNLIHRGRSAQEAADWIRARS